MKTSYALNENLQLAALCVPQIQSDSPDGILMWVSMFSQPSAELPRASACEQLHNAAVGKRTNAHDSLAPVTIESNWSYAALR